MTQRFCRSCNKWHVLDEWPAECVPAISVGRSDALPVPHFISDTMAPTEHIDGNFYTSKSQFRAVTKANDCTEIGNDPARLRKPTMVKPDKAKNREALQRAEYMVRNGMTVSTAN